MPLPKYDVFIGNVVSHADFNLDVTLEWAVSTYRSTASHCDSSIRFNYPHISILNLLTFAQGVLGYNRTPLALPCRHVFHTTRQFERQSALITVLVMGQARTVSAAGRRASASRVYFTSPLYLVGILQRVANSRLMSSPHRT